MSDVDLSARADILGRQVRNFDLVDYEIRTNDAADTYTFTGIACTVDHPYQVRDFLGEYTETITAGAFNRTLNDPGARVELRWNHDARREAYAVWDASTGASTLTLAADPHLRVSATLDKTRPDVQVLRSMLDRHEVNQMSVGFNDVKGAVDWNDDYTERTVNDLRLIETSIVGRGANDLTEASVRSLAAELQRLNAHEVDEAELRRAIAWLTGLLPEPEPEPTGLVITDEFIAALANRHRLPTG